MNYKMIAVSVWTGLLVVLLGWSFYNNQQTAIESARIKARALWEKDILYRNWNASHGGVYALVTETTQPNPYLNVSERDIETPSGKILTLINPAYMTRQMYEMAQDVYGLEGHITSLNPIRPENKADAWETTALMAFEAGQTEYSALIQEDDQSYLRLMKPLITEQACLACHEAQGYKIGDVRGGISVKVPMVDYIALAYRQDLVHFVAYLIIWVVGAVAIFWMAGTIEQQIRKIQAHQKELEHTITDRELMNEALRESEGRFRSLFENTHTVMLIVDPQNGDIIEANLAASIFYGWSIETLKRMKVIDLNILDPDHLHREMQAAHLEKRQYFHFRHRLANGLIRDVDIYSGPIKVGNRELLYSIIHDVTERARAEERLRLLNQAVEHSSVSVMITDIEGTIQYVNPRFTQVTGYRADEAIGQNPRFLKSGRHSPEFYQEFWDTLTAAQEWRGELCNKKKNGELFWELASIAGVKNDNGKITHYVAVKEDITQRKHLEEETLRQERLAAVGRLAAGIAHDFNNILTSMIGFADLLKRKSAVPEAVHPELNSIIEQGQRAAQLIRQVLDFSRQTTYTRQSLDLRVYLNETLQFIERTIPETIRIRININRGDYTISADPAQLQQVITNLAVNARDAMAGGGVVYFDLSRINLSPDESLPCTEMPEVQTRDWVRLTVTDNGSGIAPEVLPHIFEPFFTTKDIGQGTGLGLAQIYGIVMQHDGCIDVESQLGQGTKFTLYFPALTPQTAVETEPAEVISKGNNEIILLVEDDPVVLEVAQSMLETLNYRALVARDGVEAFALYQACADQIALVLTDAVMPGMDGFALASALGIETPDLPVVLITGYAHDLEPAPAPRQNIAVRLQKPLNLYELSLTLRQILD